MYLHNNKNCYFKKISLPVQDKLFVHLSGEHYRTVGPLILFNCIYQGIQRRMVLVVNIFVFFESLVIQVTSLFQLVEDPNQVNIHQFYPELEHQFMKSHSKFNEDQQNQVRNCL